MDIKKDKRFAHVVNDPRFKKFPKSERKIKIDKRFESMFKDNKFKLKSSVDKRGRLVSHSTKEDLKRLYDVQSTSSSSDEENESNENCQIIENSKILSSENINKKDISEENNKIDEPGQFVRPPEYFEEKQTSDEEKISKDIKKKLRNLQVDYARGEGKLISESSSDDDETDQEEDDINLEHAWGELDRDADRTDEITNRLACCNMDWDRIRAVDLMVLFNSFISKTGRILSITIYPSEYGLKRMQQEEVNGPIELTENPQELTEEDQDENEEGSSFNMEKLREYQLNRLKYYYGVVVCDTPETANKLYTECDGLEYESSATRIDLRFIPNDTQFDDQPPKETCQSMPEKYEPRYFNTTALQQVKVKLTWDETDPNREQFAEKLLKQSKIKIVDDIDDEDLRNYLASSSSSSSSSNEDSDHDDIYSQTKEPSVEVYKQLLEEIEKGEKEEKMKRNGDLGEMEISWGIDLKEKTEELVMKKVNEKFMTPFEQILEKRKLKKKLKKVERLKKIKGDVGGEDDGEDGKSSSDEDDVDLNDPYFAEEFNEGVRKSGKKGGIDDGSSRVEGGYVDKRKKIGNVLKKNDADGGDAELELLMMNDGLDDGKHHFSMKKLENVEMGKKKKWKKGKKKLSGDVKDVVEDNFNVNLNDERFSAIYSSHLYNIDPTDPHFRKTKAMDKLIEEKFKRKERDDQCGISRKREKIDVDKNGSELNVLIKSVKCKTDLFNKKF